MITANVIHRTFRLRWGGGEGTCFTVDVEGRQYVVTARHVLPDLQVGADAQIELFRQDRWKRVSVQVVWLSDVRDVAILAPDIQLSPPFDLEPTTAGLTFGQQVYFCGFTRLTAAPQQLNHINRGFPLPLVRQGILAGWEDNNGNEVMIIDGHNIPGFSGGPVVFQPPGSTEFRVAGVVSEYCVDQQPVMLGHEETDMHVRSNSGLVIANSFPDGIGHVKAHPSGVEIAAG